MKLLLVWGEEVFKCKRKYEKISEEKFVNSNLWLKQAWTKSMNMKNRIDKRM